MEMSYVAAAEPAPNPRFTSARRLTPDVGRRAENGRGELALIDVLFILTRFQSKENAE